MKRKQEEGRRKKRTKGMEIPENTQNNGKIKADMNFKAERNVECEMYVQKNAVLLAFFTAGVTCVLVCEYVSCLCVLETCVT